MAPTPPREPCPFHPPNFSNSLCAVVLMLVLFVFFSKWVYRRRRLGRNKNQSTPCGPLQTACTWSRGRGPGGLTPERARTEQVAGRPAHGRPQKITDDRNQTPCPQSTPAGESRGSSELSGDETGRGWTGNSSWTRVRTLLLLMCNASLCPIFNKISFQK